MKNYNCLLWGTGRVFDENIRIVVNRLGELDISIIGITSNDEREYTKFHNIDFISKQNLKNVEFDFVISLAGDKWIKSIADELKNYKAFFVPIWPFRVLLKQYFNVNDYYRLSINPPSILSQNCWGGITSYQLGLPFKSPTKNMFFQTDGMLSLLENPKRYFELELLYDRSETAFHSGGLFPVGKLDDVELFFNHSSSFEMAKGMWNKNIDKVDLANIFPMIMAEHPKQIERFANLPYKKKICFTKLDITDVPGVVRLNENVNHDFKDLYLWQCVIGCGWEKYDVYNPIRLLLNGEY